VFDVLNFLKTTPYFIHVEHFNYLSMIPLYQPTSMYVFLLILPGEYDEIIINMITFIFNSISYFGSTLIHKCQYDLAVINILGHKNIAINNF